MRRGKPLARILFLLALSLVASLRGWAAEKPMSQTFRTSDGLNLHYLEAGTAAQTLVFIPGWLMPAAIFEKQLAALSGRFRVLAFDPRSQGQSDVATGDHSPQVRLRDLHEFLAAAHVQEFVLAGWSLGVLESLDFVERYQPPGLRGLILIDNSIGEGTPPPPRKSGYADNFSDDKRRREFLGEFSRSMFRAPPPETISQAVLASALRVPPAAARQLIAQPYPRTYWRDIVAAQKIPVLYAITPRLREQGAALLRRKPAAFADVVVFENAGHALFVDDAAAFNRVVERFARRAFSGAAVPPVGQLPD